MKINLMRGISSFILRSIGIICISILYIAFVSLPSPVRAAGNEIHSIHIDIVLTQDGAAHIMETWDMTIAEGTEMYLVQGSLGAIEIKDFSVTDESGTIYENTGSWNLNRSLQEKKETCGIYDAGGHLELCWGVGSYGEHTYQASYTMTNFVKEYADGYLGFNQRIINDELSSVPGKVSASIRVEGVSLTSDNTRIWAFGYPGEIYVQNEQIEAYSEGSLYSSSYMTILAQFEPGVVAEGYSVSNTFEQVKEKALEGSSYQQEKETTSEGSAYQQESSSASGTIPASSTKSGGVIRGILRVLSRLFSSLFSFAFFIIVIVLIMRARQNGTSSSHGMRGGSTLQTINGARAVPSLQYWRDIPLNGDIRAAWFVIVNTEARKEEGRLMGACLLKWLLRGSIRVEERSLKKMFGLSEKVETVITFVRPPHDAYEAQLYHYFQQASRDGILEEKEFYKWSRKNYAKLEAWMAGFNRQGEDGFGRGMGGLQEVPNDSWFGRLLKLTKVVYTERGLELVAQLRGFKNYLKDFTLLQERPATDVNLWREYLIFAALFGIAKEVANQFKGLYPDYLAKLDPGNSGLSTFDTIVLFSYMDHMAGSAVKGMHDGRAAADSASSGGGGSSSSSGGGGGSSGGGSGGGVR